MKLNNYIIGIIHLGYTGYKKVLHIDGMIECLLFRTNNLKEDVDVIFGQGIDKYNIDEYWNFADAFIIGSSLKKDGYWENDIDLERVKQFLQKINQPRT